MWVTLLAQVPQLFSFESNFGSHWASEMSNFHRQLITLVKPQGIEHKVQPTLPNLYLHSQAFLAFCLVS